VAVDGPQGGDARELDANSATETGFKPSPADSFRAVSMRHERMPIESGR
jgi:hypothetical protein